MSPDLYVHSRTNKFVLCSWLCVINLENDIIFTNGVVSLSTDLVFGPCVLNDLGWFPIDQLCEEDIEIVLNALDNNPTCPAVFYEALRANCEKCPFCGIRSPRICSSAPPDICELATTHFIP
jgi:hypothetical protein